MGSEHCWECGEEYSRNEVFDIPIFKLGWTVKWCFNCAMKQLEWSDYRLIPKSDKYKKFKIKSFEDHLKLDSFYLDELMEGYKEQFGEITHKDWEILHQVSWDMVQGLEDES